MLKLMKGNFKMYGIIKGVYVNIYTLMRLIKTSLLIK